MTRLLIWAPVVGTLSLTLAATGAVWGKDSVSQYEALIRGLAKQAEDNWRTGAVAARSSASQFAASGASGTTSDRAEMREAALEQYVAKLATEMKPSPAVAHIPRDHPVQVDDQNPSKRWTKFYAEAKNSLRPHVDYQWQSNAAQHPVKIRLTEGHIETLKANFDVLMWYRNELDDVDRGYQHEGAKKFKLFLDHFVANLLDGLPGAPEIDLRTGMVNGDKWELDEQNLREQLIMAYRYLVAKHQVYPDYDDFGPADRELLVSMMKIAFLVGARLDPAWFEETQVNLQQVSKRTQWKKPIVDALANLKNQQADRPQAAKPCVIAIPPPKPKAAATPPAASEPPPAAGEQRVEIIIRPQS